MSGIDTDAALWRRLGHEFRDPALAGQALTHRSHSNCHYERMEFLGDSILNFIIAQDLFERFPQLREGNLMRMRARIIRNETLAEVARELHIGAHLRLGSAEMKSGVQRRDSVLADVLEALICAIYLDGGLEAARGCALRWFDSRLREIQPGESTKDPKSRLQEWLQARGRALPVYTLAATHGEEHNQQFEVICAVPSVEQQFAGSGGSRRAAEQDAAQRAVDYLEQTR